VQDARPHHGGEGEGDPESYAYELLIVGSAPQRRRQQEEQVLWGCHAFNATPEEAARTVVADLYRLLSRGGSVTVHIEDADGSERTLEVSAG